MAESSKKSVVLGVTGGIAAYKAAELVRELARSGIEVQVVMTEAAASLVAPATFQALSGKPVYTDLWDARVADNMAHIELSRGKDAIVVAPATADFIAKLAQGLADDLLSTLCLARECPLIVAPAMNRQMWDNPATRRNIERLLRDGVAILGPASGDQACGEVGMGRMLEAPEIAEAVTAFLAPKSLRGTRVLITAGPTFETIDAVRGITNRSSGKMGYAVARAALEAGARVSLISGPTSLTAPAGAQRVDVVSARHVRGGEKARRRHRHLHQCRRGCRLPRRHSAPAEDQEDRRQAPARPRAQPGYPGVGRGPAAAAVLRRFCGGNGKPASACRGQAPQQESAVARSESRAAGNRRGR